MVHGRKFALKIGGGGFNWDREVETKIIIVGNDQSIQKIGVKGGKTIWMITFSVALLDTIFPKSKEGVQRDKVERER